jgi:hypothetical protein
MNRTVGKCTVDAAKYFKEEVLEIMPDIPAEQLSDMVNSYIYYQQDVTRDEAQDAVQRTCSRTGSAVPAIPSFAKRRGY